MHTVCGVLKGFWLLLQGLHEQRRVHQYEARVNSRRFNGCHLASKPPVWLQCSIAILISLRRRGIEEASNPFLPPPLP
jgi:hypothetical protein